MPAHLRLRDVFERLATSWPFQVVNGNPGWATAGPTPATAWLEELDDALHLHDVRTDVQGGIVAIEAIASFEPVRSAGGVPFYLAALPDFELRVLPVSEPRLRLHVALGPAGAEVLLEGVPVELSIPKDLVGPYPREDLGVEGERRTGAFEAGVPDGQEVLLTPHGPTRVRTHFRVHVTPELEISLTPAVPISFSMCSFMGLPCRAIHGLELLPSATLEPRTREWIRHPVSWAVQHGAVAFRSVDFDLGAPPFRDARSAAEEHERAEWVLEDVVVGVPSTMLFPIPAHFTFGVRRKLETVEDPSDVFVFDRSPVRVPLDHGGGTHIEISRLLVRTTADGAELDLAAALSTDLAAVRDWALTFGADQNLTFRIGLTREPRDDSWESEVLRIALSDWVEIDLVGLAFGYSFGKADQGFPFEQCFELVGDLWIHHPDASLPPRPGEPAPAEPAPAEPDPEAASGVRIETTGGRPFSMVVQGLGWKQGTFTFGESLSLPDGAVVKVGPVGLLIFDLGSTTEEGAGYISISGGLSIDQAGFEIAAWFRRLRFKMSGDPSAPPMKVDGFGLLARIPEVLRIEILGYFTEEIVRPEGEPALRRKELGLSGSLELTLGSSTYLFLIDLINGRISGVDPAAHVPSFTYLMFQVVVEGQLTIGAVELRGGRFLFADNMLPALEHVGSAGERADDAGSGPLRYYSWAQRNDPLRVDAERRLAAWRPQNGATAFGVGLALSFAGMGETFRLQAFVMYVDGPDERGLLIALELFLGQSRRPVAWAVLEYDFRNDRFSLLLGIDLTLGHLVENAPEAFADVFRIRGTLFIGNKPGTFALGRLDDQASWLMLHFDLNLFEVLRVFITVALCIEIVEDGPEGFAFVFRIEGGVNLGILGIELYAGISLLVRSLDTGSGDLAVVATAELGLSITLLQIFRFGVSIAGDIHHVAFTPTYTVCRLVFTIETPWFLPDVTFTAECVDGSILPPVRAMATAPLLSAAASHEATGRSASIHVERLALEARRRRPPPPEPEAPAGPVLSLEDLRALDLPEGERLARFASETPELLATDATISLVFSAMVEDALGIGGTNAASGTQTSGNESVSLSLRYRLVGLTVRRRPRSGTDRPWSRLEERRELRLELEEGSLEVTGVLDPEELNKVWDVDTQVAGEVAPKKLLINASTPFELTTHNAYGDEALLAADLSWPCCHPQPPAMHRFDFRGEPAGPLVALRRRVFAGTESTVWPNPATVIGPPSVRDGLGPAESGVHVASIDASVPGAALRVAFDEDAVYVEIRLAGWSPAAFRVEPTLRDAHGAPVAASGPASLAGAHGWRTVTLVGSQPFRSLELRVRGGMVPGQPVPQPPGSAWPVLEIDHLAYVSWADYCRWWREDRHCAGGAGAGALSGRGKLFFLPNHEYELAVTTEISVCHSSTEWEALDVTEYVHFATKGLPGLNAVKQVGAELHPYVASAYGGGKGLLYREEPVVLQLDEDLSVVLPIDRRPAGSSEERHQLLELALTVCPERPPEAKHEVASATAQDWIVAHRRVPLLAGAFPLWQLTSGLHVVPVLSSDPARERLAALTQRPEVGCAPADPREVERGTLVALPPMPAGAPADERLWPSSTSYRATVRPRNSPFVHRPSFESADLTALSLLDPSGAEDRASWAEVEGALRPRPGLHLAQIGEPDWNHVRITVGLELAAGSFAVAVGMAPGHLDGLFARVERDGEALALAIRAGPGGPVLSQGTGAVATGGAVSLVVTAFDDLLRLEVGETMVEAPRGVVREGLVGLVADGDLRVRSLFVEGLAMYDFGFKTSRYKSFGEHVGAFEPVLEVIEPDDLGAGARSASVAELRAEGSGRLGEVMRLEAPPSARESLFVDWASRLALPLARTVETPRLSEVRGLRGVEAILLESPEPLDFVEEIAATLTHEVRVAAPGATVRLPPWLAELLEEIETAGVLPRLRPPFPEPPPPTFEASLKAAGLPGPAASGHLPWALRTSPPARSPFALPAPLKQGKGVLPFPPKKRPAAAVASGGVRLLTTVDSGVVLRLPDDLMLARERRPVALVTVEPSCDDSLHVRVLRGRAGTDGRHVLARLSGTETPTVLAGRPGAPAFGGQAVAITVDLLERSVLGVLPWGPLRLPETTWAEIAVELLQNGDATKALIVPVAGVLHPGPYRLGLRLHRRRFESRGPEDTLSVYAAERSVPFTL